MKKMLNMIMVLTTVVSTAACAPKHGKKTSSIPYVDYSSEYVVEGETIDVPFSSQGGVKYVTVKVNGLTTDMIFDTGCSITLLSMHEAQQLASRGLLTKEDYVGKSKSVIADGSVVEDAIYKLSTLEITGGTEPIICRDVTVQVSSNAEAPVLLGNGVLDRVASYTIDNEEKVIRFKLK